MQFVFSRRKMKSKDMPEPWWTKPYIFFLVPSSLFWFIVLWSFVQVHMQQVQLEQYGLSKQDMAAVTCNQAHRPVTTCAHRANAAELLQSAGVSKDASLLQAMQVLWDAGILCFDVDVIALQGGDMIVGHPADMAARVDAAALNSLNSSSSSSKSGSAQKPASVSPDQLHTFSLQQLRSAGLTEAVAPTLPAVLQTFKQLLTKAPAAAANSTSSSSSVLLLPAREAAARRSWSRVPVISLEPKGPAAVDAQAFMKVSQLAAAAGVSQHTLLWMRQMPAATAAAVAKPSTSAAPTPNPAAATTGVGGVVVTQLATSIKEALQGNSRRSNSSSSIGPSGVQGGGAAGLGKDRPLLGLIITDMLLQKPHLAALQGDASKLTPALVSTAGGAANDAAVFSAFDLLAPSVKLPAEVLEALLSRKPCLSWTLEGVGHIRKALWLGLDVAITNTPIAQQAVMSQEGPDFCNKGQ